MDSYVLTTTKNVLGCTMKPATNCDRDTIFSWLIEHGYAGEKLETCTKLELLARVRKVHVVAKYEVLIIIYLMLTFTFSTCFMKFTFLLANITMFRWMKYWKKRKSLFCVSHLSTVSWMQSVWTFYCVDSTVIYCNISIIIDRKSNDREIIYEPHELAIRICLFLSALHSISFIEKHESWKCLISASSCCFKLLLHYNINQI